MKLKTILGAAAIAASSAALMSATPASAKTTYSFLDSDSDFFFAVEDAPITVQTTVVPSDCSVYSICGTVTFTPTTGYDELTLKNGVDYYYSPTAFTTVGTYIGGDSQFSTQIFSAAPEPASWALMIAGVGLAGVMLRYGRRQDRGFGAA